MILRQVVFGPSFKEHWPQRPLTSHTSPFPGHLRLSQTAALSPARTSCLQTPPELTCLCFPPCFPKCVAVAWLSQASSSRTRSTSAPRTTSNSTAPAVTAAGILSRARSSLRWAAPTTPSASCAACAGEQQASGGGDPLPGILRKGRNGLSQADPGLTRLFAGHLHPLISGVEGPDRLVVFKHLAAESCLSNVI